MAWTGGLSKALSPIWAPEGGHSVHLRLRAWAKHHGIELDDSLPFRTIPMRIDLCHADEDVETIITNIRGAAEELGPCQLIVVDTVSRALAGGDENGPTDMGSFVARGVTGCARRRALR